MKKQPCSLFLLALLSVPAFAQWSPQRTDPDCARLSLETDTLNYGTIIRNAYAYRKLKYTNTGKCPLIIWSVSGLNYRQIALSKNFLQPGDSGTLSIYLPTSAEGRFLYVIVLYSNTAKAQMIYLTGTIVHEPICANMSFAADTLNLGPVHYVFGKHFAIKVPSTGKCPLMFNVSPSEDEYMNMIDYSEIPISTGDSGIIDIHIGGEVMGHYYGMLHITSPNSLLPQKTLFIKATLTPPDKGDSTDTEIKAEKDIIYLAGMKYAKIVVVSYTIINTGDKPLVLKSSDAKVEVPSHPVAPGKSGKVIATFMLTDTPGPFIKHINISGNFKGKTMPLYIMGRIENR